MDKLRYFAFCVSIVFVASVPAQAEVELSYEKNTFINYWSKDLSGKTSGTEPN